MFSECLGHLLSVRATCSFCHGPMLCAACPLRQGYLPFVGLRSPYTGVNVKVRMHVVLMKHLIVICIKWKSLRLQLCVNVATASLDVKATQ